MAQIYGENKEVITIPFPEEKYNHFLQEVGSTNEKELSASRLTAMMLAIIRDFKNGSVSLDELSEMFSHLWHYAFLKYSQEIQDRFSEIGDVLLDGGELNYYVRHMESPHGGNFISFMQKVMRFYDKRADIQANVKEMEKRRT